MSTSKDSLIAKKYAEALAEVELSTEILDQLKMIQVLTTESNELKSFLLNPSIKKENKIKLVKEVFADKFNKGVLSTLLLLLERRRISVIALLAESYKEVLNQRNNTQETELSTAQDLNEVEIDSIKRRLEKLFNKNIQIKHTLDKSLVAGLKIIAGDKVIDSSLKKKMNKLKDLMNI
jgi:F-type H+-transporting ATPase subunit delta